MHLFHSVDFQGNKYIFLNECFRFFHLRYFRFDRDYLFFTHNVFNLISRGLFNFFAPVSLILLLTSSFCKDLPENIIHSHPPPLWNYTGTIYNNVCNVFKRCSSMLQIHCTSFWLFMTTIDIFLSVLVYVMHLLYLRFV